MGSWEGLARRIFSPRQSSSDEYELLGTESDLPLRRTNGRHFLRRPTRSLRSWCKALVHLLTFRRIMTTVISIPFLLAIGVLMSGIPPSYNEVREYERSLPQHNLSLPLPEGSEGLYLRFPGHLWGHGLNNVLQEM